jgi:MSHA biogenesis protein MshL
MTAAVVLLVQGMPVTRLAGTVPAPSAGQGQAPAAAQRPAPQPPTGLPVTRVDPGAAAATLDSVRRLTLTFSEPRPIDDVLRLLIAGTPFSLAIDPGVSGAFRGELKQLTLRDALTTLLTPLGLEFELRGSVIRVTHYRIETRQFDVNLLALQRGMTRSSGTAAASVTTTVEPEDVFAGIGDGVRALLSSSGSVHVDRRAGLVQVSDYPERIDRVALYLEALQVRSGRQVRLQARVVEVTMTDAPALDWRAVRARLGLPPDASAAGLAADPAALQAALGGQGEVRVLSAPDVTVMNNEPALMRAAVTGKSSLTLTVVPQIASDGIVQLSVSHAWEELAAGQKTPGTRESDTVTRVMDGDTVVIAGLLRPTEVTVPARGLSAMFAGPSKKPAVAELVVLLRATVVTPGTR